MVEKATDETTINFVDRIIDMTNRLPVTLSPDYDKSFQSIKRMGDEKGSDKIMPIIIGCESDMQMARNAGMQLSAITLDAKSWSLGVANLRTHKSCSQEMKFAGIPVPIVTVESIDVVDEVQRYLASNEDK